MKFEIFADNHNYSAMDTSIVFTENDNSFTIKEIGTEGLQGDCIVYTRSFAIRAHSAVLGMHSNWFYNRLAEHGSRGQDTAPGDDTNMAPGSSTHGAPDANTNTAPSAKYSVYIDSPGEYVKMLIEVMYGLITRASPVLNKKQFPCIKCGQKRVCDDKACMSPALCDYLILAGTLGMSWLDDIIDDINPWHAAHVYWRLGLYDKACKRVRRICCKDEIQRLKIVNMWDPDMCDYMAARVVAEYMQKYPWADIIWAALAIRSDPSITLEKLLHILELVSWSKIRSEYHFALFDVIPAELREHAGWLLTALRGK